MNGIGLVTLRDKTLPDTRFALLLNKEPTNEKNNSDCCFSIFI